MDIEEFFATIDAARDAKGGGVRAYRQLPTQTRRKLMSNAFAVMEMRVGAELADSTEEREYWQQQVAQGERHFLEILQETL